MRARNNQQSEFLLITNQFSYSAINVRVIKNYAQTVEDLV